MIKREVVGRYKGSALGLVWSFINPLFLLVVYTFVFSVVFKAKWGVGSNETKTQFALILFAGMVIHGMVAECLMRGPRLIVENASYVKRVVFPLEVLPIIAVGSALFHMLTGYLVLFGGLLLINQALPTTALFLPALLVPLVIGTLGVTWFLASLGVFARDVQQVMGLVTLMLLFLTPIFFPVSALPESLRPWMRLNPMTFFVEQGRELIIFGRALDWGGLALALVLSLIVAQTGYWWFQKTRKGFADVL